MRLKSLENESEESVSGEEDDDTIEAEEMERTRRNEEDIDIVAEHEDLSHLDN
jgi:hypothetical protein